MSHSKTYGISNHTKFPHSDMNKVDKTMTEINEQRELAEEISNAISNPLNAGLDIDEVSTASLCTVCVESRLLG